jgi:hypothetical protein
MKLIPIPSLIAIAICALLSFGFYSFNTNPLRLLLSIGSFVMLSLTLIPAIGTKFNLYHKAVNIRTVASLFFATIFAVNIIFSFLIFTAPVYIVICGVLLLLYLLILYYLIRPTA